MSFIFMSLMISLAFVLSAAITPLTLGLWILLFAFIVSLTTANLISSWFGLIIFLIYIGGLLVMFSYFSAITPNQQLELGPLATLSTLSFILLSLNIDLFHTSNIFNSISLSFIGPPTTSILLPSNLLIYLALGAVLFLALVVVVKVSRLSAGPLRPFM
uniref:NADH dehydrogenase subunit 6 n=1 Tax=Cryptonome barbada TaxID=2204078 RepID=A0A343YV51_9ANNE|nr:NADH dehydrogenase subunit 6 [Cryptonome barbada]AWN55972.1 NADH dehydrogenase subunit 6 [Cryptonome barbada]